MDYMNDNECEPDQTTQKTYRHSIVVCGSEFRKTLQSFSTNSCPVVEVFRQMQTFPHPQIKHIAKYSTMEGPHVVYLSM